MIVETSRGFVYSSSSRHKSQCSGLASPGRQPRPGSLARPPMTYTRSWLWGSGNTCGQRGGRLHLFTCVSVTHPGAARGETRAARGHPAHVGPRVQTGGGDQLSGDCRLTKAASRHGDQDQALLLIITSLLCPISQSMINKLSTPPELD